MSSDIVVHVFVRLLAPFKLEMLLPVKEKWASSDYNRVHCHYHHWNWHQYFITTQLRPSKQPYFIHENKQCVQIAVSPRLLHL